MAGTMTTVDAVAVLRGLIAQAALKMPIERYHGYDWYQLADQEADVFGIDPDDMPMMVATYEAFETFHGITSGAHFDMHHQAEIDAAKAARPDLAAMDPYEQLSWRAFATVFSILSNRQAWQWWAKYDAYMVREGIMYFADERTDEG